ncbi:ATPase, E1-E2 type [Richelia intracellularis HM01]|nr:ATPase, E1-E2 type [Richelia intracellularis HM01]
MVFTALCIAQMGHAIAIRSNHRLTIEMNPFSNIFVLGAVVVTTIFAVDVNLCSASSFLLWYSYPQYTGIIYLSWL